MTPPELKCACVSVSSILRAVTVQCRRHRSREWVSLR